MCATVAFSRYSFKWVQGHALLQLSTIFVFQLLGYLKLFSLCSIVECELIDFRFSRATCLRLLTLNSECSLCVKRNRSFNILVPVELFGAQISDWIFFEGPLLLCRALTNAW